jgi:SAM-dependent methyltransferase
MGLIDLGRKVLPTAVKRVLSPLMPRKIEEARSYVGTDEISGHLQFELLKRQGCTPASKVLEVGCGSLHASLPVIQYLEKGNYVGLDPNVWLRKTAMKDRNVRRLVKEKRARFLTVSDFDASRLDVQFDYVFSHSILSHCAHWQLEQFLQNIAKVLAVKGRVLASIRLAEGNPFGSAGTEDREDSKHETWQYPGVTWFKLSTVIETADKQGLMALHIPEYTEFYTQTRPNEYHDWFVFSWKPSR